MTIGCLIGISHRPTTGALLQNGLFALPVVPSSGSWTLASTPKGWSSTGTVSMAVAHNYTPSTFYPRWGGSVTDVSQCVRLHTGASLSTTVYGLVIGTVYSVYYWRRTEITYSDLSLTCSVNGTTVVTEASAGSGNNTGSCKTGTWTANATFATLTFTCSQISTASICILAEVFFGKRHRLLGTPNAYDAGGLFTNPSAPSSAASTNYTAVGSTIETIRPDGTGSYWYGTNVKWREQLIVFTQCVYYGSDGGSVTMRATASTGPWVLGHPYVLTYYAASRADLTTNCKLVVSINGTVVKDHGEVPRSGTLTWHTVTWYCNSVSPSPVIEFTVSQATSGGRLVLATVQFRG